MTRKMPSHSSLLENAPEHLKLVGLVAVNYAHLDRTLCRLLADLDLPAAQTPTSTGNATRMELLLKLARRQSLSHESMMQLQACLARVKQCADRRDEMMKSAYGIGRDGLVISPCNDECGEIVPVTREQLREFAENIAECTVELDPVCLDGSSGSRAGAILANG
jgi:hypothetical protein